MRPRLQAGIYSPFQPVTTGTCLALSARCRQTVAWVRNDWLFSCYNLPLPVMLTAWLLIWFHCDWSRNTAFQSFYCLQKLSPNLLTTVSVRNFLLCIRFLCQVRRDFTCVAWENMAKKNFSWGASFYLLWQERKAFTWFPSGSSPEGHRGIIHDKMQVLRKRISAMPHTRLS